MTESTLKENEKNEPVVSAPVLPPQPGWLKKHQRLLKIIFLFCFTLIIVATFVWPRLSPDQKERKKEKDEILLPLSVTPQIVITPTLTPEPTFSSKKIEGKIAFTRGDICQTDRDIWVINADGDDEARLTENGVNEHPVFSPDGQWVAYLTVDKETKKKIKEGNCLLYGSIKNRVGIVRPDGSENRQLVSQNILIPNDIYWSPDSQKMAVFGTKQEELIIVVIDIKKKSEMIFEDPAPPRRWPYKPVWLNGNDFLYVRYVRHPQILDNAALVMADSEIGSTPVVTRDIRFTDSMTPFENGKKVFFWSEGSFWQLEIANVKIQKIKPVPPRANLTNAILDTQHGQVINILPGQDDDILIINLAEGKATRLKTELLLNGSDRWDTDGEWLILSVLGEMEDDEEGNSLWRFHLQSQTKEKIIDNAFDPDWYF